MAKVNIMVVEDDAITAMDIENQLKNLGYGVSAKTAYGKDAIQKAKENTPDLVLMDIVLKGEMDGIETAKEIHTQFDIPVVFLTAFADKNRLEKAKLTYPFGFILKPFQDKDFQVTIEMALYVAKVDAKRKQAKEALRESEEMFRLFTEQNMMGVIIIQDGLVKYVNQATSEITEYSIGEALDWKPNEFGKLFHPDDLEFVMEQAQKKQEGAKDVVTHYSYRLITKSGEVKWIDQYSKTITFEGKNADLITIIDITERKQVEEALRESEEKYRSLVTNIPGITWTTDHDFNTVFVSPNIQKELGYTPEEVYKSGDSIFPGRIHPEGSQQGVNRGVNRVTS